MAGMLRLVSLFGLLALLGLCYALSRDRKAISWRLVGGGLAIQLVLGFVFVGWEDGRNALYEVGLAVERFLKLAAAGTGFVFGPLATGDAVESTFGASGVFIFATMVLPTLIFFSSLMSVLYHLGVMQLVVKGMAWVMARVLGTSGAESLSACGNVFVGQTEAPLLVRPFLQRMTMSELHAIMTGGFATIAGGVFALYVLFGMEPGHLMVASVMAVPAGLVVSKILYPETEESETAGRVVMHDEKTASNVVEAAASGASDGLKLALNVGAMLIAFLGLVAVLDAALSLFSDDLTVGTILGWMFYPIAFVMGVQSDEVMTLAELLGTKIALTELVAYGQLGAMRESISERTYMIATFALCGFANFGSVAIQIGGLSAIAPKRRSDLSKIALRAMFAGAIATCATGCLAGVLSNV